MEGFNRSAFVPFFESPGTRHGSASFALKMLREKAVSVTTIDKMMLLAAGKRKEPSKARACSLNRFFLATSCRSFSSSLAAVSVTMRANYSSHLHLHWAATNVDRSLLQLIVVRVLPLPAGHCNHVTGGRNYPSYPLPARSFSFLLRSFKPR